MKSKTALMHYPLGSYAFLAAKGTWLPAVVKIVGHLHGRHETHEKDSYVLAVNWMTEPSTSFPNLDSPPEWLKVIAGDPDYDALIDLDDMKGQPRPGASSFLTPFAQLRLRYSTIAGLTVTSVMHGNGFVGALVGDPLKPEKIIVYRGDLVRGDFVGKSAGVYRHNPWKNPLTFTIISLRQRDALRKLRYSTQVLEQYTRSNGITSNHLAILVKDTMAEMAEQANELGMGAQIDTLIQTAGWDPEEFKEWVDSVSLETWYCLICHEYQGTGLPSRACANCGEAICPTCYDEVEICPKCNERIDGLPF